MKCALKSCMAASLVLALSAGCSRPVSQIPAPEPAAHRPAEPQTSSSAPALAFTTGTVVETMDSGGYTYLCIENAGQKRWAAVPQTGVAVGEEVELMPGSDMHNFTSKTLGRTFDSITFCSGLVRKGDAPAPAASAPPAAPAAAPHGMGGGHKMGMGHSAPAASAAIAGTVVETMDGGGYTYVSLDQDGQQTWVAVPAMKVKVGDQLQLSPGMVMKNFTSKALNRTFESIVFSSGPAAAR